MRLYLVQHGRAKSKEVDPDRHLSDQGVQETQRLAEFLRPLGLPVAEVWHSSKARSVQTAEILRPALSDSPEIIQQSGIEPYDPVEPITARLAGTEQDVLIAGHVPFLVKLASVLVASDETNEVCSFQQRGVVCLERTETRGWVVCWMVVLDSLRGIPHG